MHATTHYSAIDRVASKAAWVSLKPVTGRQHQLRAHMALIGHPIVGDNKYDADKSLPAEEIQGKLHRTRAVSRGPTVHRRQDRCDGAAARADARHLGAVGARCERYEEQR